MDTSPQDQVITAENAQDVNAVDDTMIDGEESPRRSATSSVPTPAEEDGVTQSTENIHGSPILRRNPDEQQVNDDHEMMGTFEILLACHNADEVKVDGLSSSSPDDDHVQFGERQVPRESDSP